MSEKRFKIDTISEIGHIYINNQDGEHMSWIEVENTLNEQQDTISKLIEELELTANTKIFSRRELERKVKEQAETIRKQSIRIYCQDKEVQRLLGELEKIPKSIREVWLED